METLTHWRKERNPNYLGSWDLLLGGNENGEAVYEEKIVFIEKVYKAQISDMENMKKGNNDATKEAILAKFKEFEKPMVLQAVSVKKGMERATGTPFIEKWAGKQVCLYVEKGVKAFGDKVDALRIKPIPKRICSKCGKVIDENIYQISIKKYGQAYCSKSCVGVTNEN